VRRSIVEGGRSGRTARFCSDLAFEGERVDHALGEFFFFGGLGYVVVLDELLHV